MRVLATWLLLMILWVGTAMAQDSGIRCVQNLLQAAGHNPGPADGISGRRTRLAMAAFFHEHGQTPPVILTQDNGAVLCRLMGQTNPSLQVYWPSRQGPPVEVTSSGRVAQEIVDAVYGSAMKVLQRYHDRYGIDLPIPVQILVADQASDLEGLLMSSAEGRLFDVRAQAEIHCDVRPDGVAGLAYFDLLAVCLYPNEQLDANFTRTDIMQVVSHELTHAVQAHLVGRAPRNYDLTREPGYRGPLWLTEGSAELLAAMMSYRDMTPRELADGLTGFLRGSGTWPDLERLAIRPTDDLSIGHLYSGGALAVAGLLSPEPEDVQNLLGYYEDLGLGIPWRVAFRDRFGRSVTQVYTEFQNLGPERK